MIGKIVLYVALIGLLIASSYYLYLEISDLRAEPVKFLHNKTISRNQSSYSSQLQFYPDMRFPKKDIFYNIDFSCGEDKKTRMLQAFTRLEQETDLIKFYSSQQEPDILVSCQETEVEQEAGKYFIAGEGGPTTIINTTKFYIIEKGKVLLFYKENSCNNYNVELHELLHVFGFEHSNNKESIMYNTTFCYQVLTDDIAAELKRLYLIPELPDLYFNNVSVIKHGSYLDFEIDVRNQGLANSENISLDLFSEEKIDSFELGNISYGEGKLFQAKNIKISRSLKKIKFILVDGKELEKENNEIELFLAE